LAEVDGGPNAGVITGSADGAGAVGAGPNAGVIAGSADGAGAV